MRIWSAVWRIAYRRLRSATGRVGAWGVVAAVPLAATALWVYLWTPLHGFFESINDPSVGPPIAMALLASFFLLTVLIRVGMLAFDVIGRELRLVLAVAPLGRLRRSAIMVLPEFLAGWSVAVGVGGTAIVVFASVSPDFGVIEAVAWMTVVVVWVGALSAAVEDLGVRLTSSLFVARAMASIVLLGVALATLTRVASLISDGAPSGPWPTLPSAATGPRSVAAAGLLIVVGITSWLGAASATVTSMSAVPLKRLRRRPLRLPSPPGAVSAAAIRSLQREPSNRAAAFGFAVILVALIEFTRLIDLDDLTAQAVTWAAVVATGFVTLTNYGSFLEIRRVVATSPSPMAAALCWWNTSRLLVGTAVVAGVGFGVWAMFGRGLPSTPMSAPTLAIGWLVTTGAALVAGRLIPYRKTDLMSMTANGLLASAGAAGAGVVTARTASHAGLGVALAVAAVWLLTGLVAGSRPQDAA